MRRRAALRGLAGGLAAVGAVAGILVGVGSGGIPADLWSMGDGMAWLPSSATGELVLLDGTTGRLASRVGGIGTGNLDTALRGGDALVVNPDREALFRVDGKTQALARLGAGGEPGVRFDGAERVLVGGDVGYVVQPGRQRVQPIDPVTLRPLGDPVTFVGSDFDAAADEQGVLWLLDREVGRLQAVERSRLVLTVDLGWRDHDASVVLVAGSPVVVDRTTGSVTAVGHADGRVDERTECSWFRAGDGGVRAAGSAPSGPSWLTLAVPEAGSVLVARLGSDRCPAPIAVGDPGVAFGVPVSTEGLVYVPVISTGQVVVIDPNRNIAVAEAQVVDRPGTEFELLVDDGLVFFNAPFSHEAGTVSDSGDVTRVDKSPADGNTGGEADSPCEVSTQEAAPGEAVQFGVDTEEEPFAAVEWRFGDGAEGSGTTVEHAYAEPGRYEPTVTVAGVVSPCPVITVGEPDGLRPRIEGPSQVQVGQTVTYRDATDAEVTSRRWNLPGGTPSTSDAAEVQVRFDTPGTQVIELTVNVAGGTATARARIEITTQPPPPNSDGGTGRTAPTTPGGPPPPPPPLPPPTTPEPPPGCQTPTATLVGSAQNVEQGESVQFDLSFGPGAGTCTVLRTAWSANGTPVASGPPTFTQVFQDAGSFDVSARFIYRTAEGSEAVGVPAPAALTVTVSPVAVSPVAVWPIVSSGLRFDDPVAAATSFAVDLAGFTNPIVGPFLQGDARSGEVEVQPAGGGSITTVLLRQLEDDNWWVLGAATEFIRLDTPSAGAVIGSPVRLTGAANVFEGNVPVTIVDDNSNVVAEDNVTGAMGEMGPFDKLVPFDSAPTNRFGAILLRTFSAADGALERAVAVRVEFAGVP